MDYLLIQAPLDENLKSSGHGEFIPYGIVVLGKALETGGYQGELLFEIQSIEDFIEKIETLDKAPSLIGISASTWSRFKAIDIIRQIRKKLPKATIVVGGFHFGNCAEDTIRTVPEIDIVVRGEGDEVILDLMAYALGEKNITEICGISYRSADGKVESPGERCFVESLTSLDFLDHDLTKEDFERNILHPDTPIPSMNMFTGRGCPFGCIFCSVARINNRKYPVDIVVDKIEEYRTRYGVRGVKFQDDSLTLNEKYVSALCDEIIRRNLDIRWWCDSRADINDEVLEKMYAAGCRYVSVGLETGSPRIQKVIGKKIGSATIRTFAGKCKELGIGCFVFLMAGFPDETWEDLQMTVDLAAELSKKHGALAGSMGYTNILPGTRIETIARERGLLPVDFSWSKDYHQPENEDFGAFPNVPLYREHLTAEMFHLAQQKMLVNYGAGLGLKKFIREVFENLFMRSDRTWQEKLRLGFSILWQKIAMR